MNTTTPTLPPIATRFHGYLPVIVDVETGGFHPGKDALLEIAFSIITIDEVGRFVYSETENFHIIPFPGANIDPRALAFNKIDPTHPFRFAVSEHEALQTMYTKVKHAVKQNYCKRAVLVGHNPAFDLSFIQAATRRCRIKHAPFHSFTTFDTATLGGLAFGHTVLARSIKAAKIAYNPEEAHSALYDTTKTAELFCHIFNHFSPCHIDS